MAKATEGKAMLQVTIEPDTQRLLTELAGGPRKVGRYLDKVVPALHEMHERIGKAEKAARDRVLAEVLLIMEKETDES